MAPTCPVCFSFSVACGLELYNNHVPDLADVDATIKFTRTINNLFDLLNIRLPADGIRLNSKRDKLKVIINSLLVVYHGSS
jgi:hypothetical protein